MSFDDLLDYHYHFESIHPFQDGNGRVGRLILFKECLRNRIVPFIIEDDMKMHNYRGLQEWRNKPAFIEQVKDVIDYRVMDYYQRRYTEQRQAEE